MELRKIFALRYARPSLPTPTSIRSLTGRELQIRNLEHRLLKLRHSNSENDCVETRGHLCRACEERQSRLQQPQQHRPFTYACDSATHLSAAQPTGRVSAMAAKQGDADAADCAEVRGGSDTSAQAASPLLFLILRCFLFS